MPNSKLDWSEELKKWFIAFAAAFGSTLLISIAQYAGAHIPALLHLGCNIIAAYGGLKIYS